MKFNCANMIKRNITFIVIGLPLALSISIFTERIQNNTLSWTLNFIMLYLIAYLVAFIIKKCKYIKMNGICLVYEDSFTLKLDKKEQVIRIIDIKYIEYISNTLENKLFNATRDMFIIRLIDNKMIKLIDAPDEDINNIQNRSLYKLCNYIYKRYNFKKDYKELYRFNNL